MIWFVVLFAIAAVVGQQRTVAAGRMATAIAAWLKAGRTPVQALEGLRDSTESPAIKQGLAAAVREMQAGASLSQALADCGLVLPPSFLDGLRAVEQSGYVNDWLDREAERFTWRADLRGKGIVGLIYPLLVLVVMFETGHFLATYILPTFVSLFEGMGMSVPWQTAAFRVLRDVGGIDGQLWVTGAVVIALVALALPRRFPLVDLLGNLPLVRRLRDLAGCEEAASMLGALLHGGMPLPDALRATARGVSSPAWRRVLSNANKDVMMGASLSDSLRRQGDVPPLFVDVCEVGERAEDLPRTLTELSDLYQSQLTRLTQRFVRMGEVAIVWAVGLLAFVYALGLWLPLVDLLGTVVP